MMTSSFQTRCGIGLRTPHYRDVLARLPPVGFLEVHSENYFGAGGQPHRYLEQLAAHYPLSLHGVGLSLGSADGLDTAHLAKLKTLVDRYQPALLSDHLCWGRVGRQHLNDLLPMPYTHEALDVMVRNVSQAQDTLGRSLLVENISSYLQFTDTDMAEADFMCELAQRSGCGILLDVNNLYVNAVNFGSDAAAFIRAMPRGVVGEIHLAGFETGSDCLIDTHSRPVCDDVWALYALALRHLGAVPSLIEWDSDIPPLDTLLSEAAHAQNLLDGVVPHACAA
jgi:hypothetical protein